MKYLRRHRWIIGLSSLVVALLMLATLSALDPLDVQGNQGAKSVPAAAEVSTVASTRVPVNERRRQSANQATQQFLADPANRGQSFDVLISFRVGVPLPVALAQLRSITPKVVPKVITLALFDATGQRHVQTVLIPPGHDPEKRAEAVSRGMVEQTKAKASAALNCKGDPGEGCTAPGDKARPGLNAVAQLDATTSRVYGIVVTATASEIETLLTTDMQMIATVEIVRGNPFIAPVWPE